MFMKEKSDGLIMVRKYFVGQIQDDGKIKRRKPLNLNICARVEPFKKSTNMKAGKKCGKSRSVGVWWQEEEEEEEAEAANLFGDIYPSAWVAVTIPPPQILFLTPQISFLTPQILFLTSQIL